jgi:hypothetical protein
MRDREHRDDQSERDEEARYEEEARHAGNVMPEYQGERLLFDELRDEPNPDIAGEQRMMGPLAAPVEDKETTPELVGEGVGGASGAIVGAAVGSLAGPLGAAVGAIAGAVGGWWAGRAVVDVASGISSDEDLAYRAQYESSPERRADQRYEDVRPAYHLGHLARLNPDYAGRSFEEIEPDLERGWTEELRAQCGAWSTIRTFAREGYLRREQHERLGGTPRTMSPTEAAREKLHRDDTAI